MVQTKKIEDMVGYTNKTGAFLARLEQIPGTVSVKASDEQGEYATIDINVDLISEFVEDYLPQIAASYNTTVEEFKKKLTANHNRSENGTLSILLPVLREHPGCYCIKIYSDETYFSEGLLKLDRYWQKFVVQILPEHRDALIRYFISLYNTSKKLHMDEEGKHRLCPHGKDVDNVGNFCKSCMRTKLALAQKEEYMKNKTITEISKEDL